MWVQNYSRTLVPNSGSEDVQEIRVDIDKLYNILAYLDSRIILQGLVHWGHIATQLHITYHPCSSVLYHNTLEPKLQSLGISNSLSTDCSKKFQRLTLDFHRTHIDRIANGLRIPMQSSFRPKKLERIIELFVFHRTSSTITTKDLLWVLTLDRRLR